MWKIRRQEWEKLRKSLPRRNEAIIKAGTSGISLRDVVTFLLGSSLSAVSLALLRLSVDGRDLLRLFPVIFGASAKFLKGKMNHCLRARFSKGL